ncbi:MAG TPA: UpxY family transcription antiterminator [Bryobacteraceae bacterium]|jgi:transcription antitermination factor NusG|nr:UpxY family transcription antiterminator [Bryobacteraceae bacterium]
MSDFALSWYALQTRANFEKQVTAQLDLKGLQNYCPCVPEIHQWADRRKRIERPVFPGYVFVRLADTAPARLMIRETHGAVRILGNADRIEPVPDQEIDSIMRMLKSPLLCFPHPYLEEGSRVRIRRGALKGVEGVLVRFKNRTRLVVSVNLLSRSIAADIDAKDVEKC